MAQLWMEVLGTQKVGMDDNFFDLGGNSLNIIQLNNLLKEHMDITVPVVTLFEYPTIRSLMDYLVRKEDGDQQVKEEIARVDEEQDQALDLMQQTMQIIEDEDEDNE